jgi:hypothetical protein
MMKYQRSLNTNLVLITCCSIISKTCATLKPCIMLILCIKVTKAYWRTPYLLMG